MFSSSSVVSVWETNVSHGLLSAVARPNPQLESYLQHLRSVGYPKWVIISGWNLACTMCGNEKHKTQLEALKPYIKDSLK